MLASEPLTLAGCFLVPWKDWLIVKVEMDNAGWGMGKEREIKDAKHQVGSRHTTFCAWMRSALI